MSISTGLLVCVGGGGRGGLMDILFLAALGVLIKKTIRNYYEISIVILLLVKFPEILHVVKSSPESSFP